MASQFKVVDLVLGVGLLGLLGLWAGSNLAPGDSDLAVSPRRSGVEETTPVQPRRFLPAAQRALLFAPPPGIVEKTEQPTPVVPAAPPAAVDKTSLVLVGTVTQGDGSSLFYIKDKRSGRILTLAEGSSSGDWTLTTGAAALFLTSPQGDKYEVKR